MIEENPMTPDARNPAGPLTLSPWLVAAAALVLYGLTLNHWVTLSSLPLASQFTGWDWHPGTTVWRPTYQAPLFLIFSAPVRLLPAALRPLGLNLFTAFCAAITLAILARTVRLLPQDRTKEQRQREMGPFGMLAVRTAFLPQAFAVLMLALSWVFWENSITATGEILDLLVFAFLIQCLLEFRITQSERRLNLFALVYGLGVTGNWALIGFFPCFLVALVWLRGRSFFDIRFILRMAGWGFLGLLLYLFIPLKGVAAHDGGFFELLHQELARQWAILRVLPRWAVLVIWAPIMLPLLFASVNWPSFEGDLNAGAHNLTRGLFRFIHIVFLGLTVLMFFTTNYSPNPQRMGLPGLLSFNYLAALSVGYFSGYVLVVFGQQVIHRWARATGILLGINRVVVVALWAAAVALPVMLFVKNRPHVQAINSEVIPEFAKLMVQAVPEKQTFLLGDDPIRLHLAAAALQKEGKLDQFVVIETQSLPYPPYLRFLAQRYPTIRSMGVDPDKIPNLISTEQLADLVFHIAQHAPVYYLHPSVGYFFERSHMVPRGLGGDIQPYTTISNAVLVQVMNPGEIRTNQAFWRAAKAEVLAPLTNAAKLSSDASRLAVFYSQDLNDWGVELQKSGTIFKDTNMLRDAGDQFADALLLNPQNFLARFNMQYNARLRGLPPPPAAGQMVSAEELSSRVGNWLPLLNTDGLPDEPDLDLKIGRQMAQSRDLFQSAQFFQRCLQLRTNNLEAELDLAKTYIDLGQYTLDQALEIIRQIRARSATVSEEVVRVEATAYTKQGRLEEADDLLAREQAKHPKEEKFLAVLVQYYRVMGYSAMHSGRADLSQKYFLKSLNAIQEQLQALNSPSAPSSSATAIPETMLVKAELQMLLKQYDQAIDTLTRLVQLDPKSPLPLLNRAIAQLQEGKLEAAKTDYLTLAKLASDNPSYMVYYGLADIAQKQANKPDAIKYFKLYKEYAPRGTPEYTNVLQQLQKLEGH